MSWSIADNRNIFLKSKSKMRLYLFVLTTPKTSPKKLSVVKMQHLPGIEKTDSEKKFLASKGQYIMVGEKYV